MGNNFKDNGDRFYDTPFGKLPSVTTILSLYDGGKSGALMGWANKVMGQYLFSLANEQGDIVLKKDEIPGIFRKTKAHHKTLQTEAMELGSEVHNLIEVYLKRQNIDGLLEANPKLKPPFEAFLKWQVEEKFEFIASERQVCSHLRYAGTLDAIAKKDDKLWVIDFKTSTGIWEDYLWQISAYREAGQDGFYFDSEQQKWIESTLRIDGGVGVLRLDKITGIPEFKPYTLLQAADGFDCFMSLCHLWHTKRQITNG